jgi:hypothetical protein
MDIVERLRDRAYSSKIPDPLVEEAAGEVEKLRQRLRLQDAVIRGGTVAALTDEERAALHWFSHYGLPEHRAAALRSLLERLA